MAGRLAQLQGRRRDDFAAYLRDHRPDLAVPEGSIVPMAGRVAWTPADESPDRGGCPKCGGGIPAGSPLYCTKCAASGHEASLAAQRMLAPPPARDRAPARPSPKAGRTRRQRRRDRRDAAGGAA